MGQAIAIPNELEVLTGEKLTLQIDFTNLIAAGDVISSPTATMVNAQANETISSSITAPSIITGNIIQLTLDCSKLRAGTSYILTWSCIGTGAGTQKSVSAELTVVVIQ